MRFVKKLYIMTGCGGKGAVTVERNALGCPAVVSLGNMPKARGRRYFAFISDNTLVFPLTGGNRFDLGGVRLSPAHVAVVRADGKDLTVELYGTDDARRMWESNLCDSVRSKINGFETAAVVEKDGEEDTSRQPQSRSALSLFTDEYDDGAIAKVNYYSNVYSSRDRTESEIAAESERLERLGSKLLSSRFDLPEDESLSLERVLQSAVSASEQAETETSAVGSAAETPETEAAAASAAAEKEDAFIREENKGEDVSDKDACSADEKELPLYARYLRGYRDKILSERAAEQTSGDTEGVRTLSEEKRNTPPAPQKVASKGESAAGSEPAEKERHTAQSGGTAADAFGKSDPDSAQTPSAPRDAERTETGDGEEKNIPLAPKSDERNSRLRFSETPTVGLNFYERIKTKLDKLFETNPREEALERLLPASRFVRIGVENSDKYYCVGLLGRPDYICYAVPAVYTPDPPEELDGYCQWLPLESESPRGNGFWLIYQDAVSGESIRKSP